MRVDFRQLKTFVRAREIISIERLAKAIGISVDDVNKAFEGYPKEYDQMQEEMKKIAEKKKQQTSSLNRK